MALGLSRKLVAKLSFDKLIIKDPKKAIGLELFSIPTLQLGDVVTINYQDINDLDLVTSPDTRFVVYNIDYSRSGAGPSMTVYLSEV